MLVACTSYRVCVSGSRASDEARPPADDGSMNDEEKEDAGPSRSVEAGPESGDCVQAKHLRSPLDQITWLSLSPGLLALLCVSLGGVLGRGRGRAGGHDGRIQAGPAHTRTGLQARTVECECVTDVILVIITTKLLPN